MKKFFKEKGKRMLFLCILNVVGLVPTTVFAFTPSEGQTVSSFYGDYYVSADGKLKAARPRGATTGFFPRWHSTQRFQALPQTRTVPLRFTH